MITNFFPLGVPAETFQIQAVDYSEERLRSLRADHNSACSFFKYDNHIYISPHVETAPELGTPVTVDPALQPDLVCSLMRHMIFRGFRDKFPDIVPVSFAPLEFRSRRASHDSVREELPETIKDKVGYPRVIRVDVASIIRNGAARFGLLISYRNRWDFAITVDELMADGYSVVDKEVLLVEPLTGLGGVLEPKESLLGRVVEANAEAVRVQTNTGIRTCDAKQLILRRSTHQIADYLRFKIGESETNKAFARRKKADATKASAGAMMSEIKQVAGYIKQCRFQNADGFSFFFSGDNRQEGPSYRLAETRLVFDYGPGSSNTNPFMGMTKYGPFDSAKFDKKTPHVLVVFRESNRGAMTEFFGRLKDGMPTSKYFNQGLKGLCSLHDLEHTLCPVDGESPEAYGTAVDNAIRENRETDFDIVLVECSDDSMHLAPQSSPYLRTKAKLMAYGLPVQNVLESHLRKPWIDDYALFMRLSLQMYAKLGGEPWRLPASQTVDKELVIGLGSSLKRNNLWTKPEQSRVVGFSTVFLGDGRYILGDNLPAVQYDDYFQTLLDHLERAINQIANDYAWKQGENVRVVFHVFKPLKNTEAKVVDELMSRFRQYNIVYAFVTVTQSHPWLMYRSAARERGNTTVEPCHRGENLIIDPCNCLVQLKGDQHRPNKSHRPPKPVKVTMHDMSTFRDMQYLSQQVLDFSHLSWRSFDPSELPVTIRYSELMADMFSKLEGIDDWNPMYIDKHFRRKKWFL